MNIARGRIRDEDIAALKDHVHLEHVIAAHVTLKNAGSGTLKGLCPFHDEKSPSFTVHPDKGFYHCFGCGESGDVISFVTKTAGLSFVEAVEHLAESAGITLTRTAASPQPGAGATSRSLKGRLRQMHTDAAAFYAHHLSTAGAAPAQQFLNERGFSPAHAEQFGCGYAPDSWDALASHLTRAGYTEQELRASGLVTETKAGGRFVDRFRGRLMWPIRDGTKATIGFGARHLLEHDEGPKYLNSPETPIYKKATVLFGLDLARKHIAATKQVAVVEGYTDVMACHAAGYPIAVATCGTAFSAEHAKTLRRFLDDTTAGAAAVIYTFDGDGAGRKAALRAAEMDPYFQARTFVAVAQDGLDPCEVRQRHGDAAIGDLLEARTPLLEFAARAALDGFDLDTPPGRRAATGAAAAVLARIGDERLRTDYARTLASWTGVSVADAAAEVAAAQASRSGGAPATLPGSGAPEPSTPDPGPTGAGIELPGAGEPGLRLARAALVALAHHPGAIGDAAAVLEPDDFTDPALAATWGLFRHAAATGPATFTDLLATAAHAGAEHVIYTLAAEHAAASGPSGALAAAVDLAAAATEDRMGALEAAMGRVDLSAADVVALDGQWQRLAERADTLTARLSALALALDGA